MPISCPLALLLVAALAMGLGACASPRDREAEVAAPPAARPAPPAPLTVTPSRFDAYLLAVQNIRAAHPRLVEVGERPAEVTEAMREAVGRAGLTLEEFRHLHRQIEADPVLKAEAGRRLAAGARARPETSGGEATGRSGGPVEPPHTAPT
ncbi:MAG TPA: hypothetical protein VFX28_06420, partial [Methylomirabilota bacterium]|nr:hypothetical protein [Methylomirabilota bacterium]